MAKCLLLRLDDSNIWGGPVSSLLILFLPDLEGQRGSIENMRPLAAEVPLFDVDQRGDDLPPGAVVVLVVQQLHHGLGHGVAGAGGDGALAGGGGCGSGGTGQLVCGRNDSQP